MGRKLIVVAAPASLALAILLVPAAPERTAPGPVGAVAIAEAPVPATPRTEPGPAHPPIRAGRALYRWRDERNVVHISTTPPPRPLVVDLVILLEEGPAPGPRVQSREAPSEASDWMTPLSVYTPGGLERLRRRTDEVATQLEERREALEQLQPQL